MPHCLSGPSLGQLEGMAAPSFLFLLLSAACRLLVGGEKLGLSCDALGRVRWPVSSWTWRLFSQLVRVEHYATLCVK